MMKRLVGMVLAFLLLAGNAVALEIEIGKEQSLAEGIIIRFNSTELLPEWKEEISDTHKWIVLWFTLTNFRKETFDAKAQLEATLEYPGGYTFSALKDIDPVVLEPLVRTKGAFVFRVPSLVAEANPDTLGFTINCEGAEYAFRPAYKKALLADRQIFFETPAEAIQYFHSCIAAGDFQGVLSVVAAQAMAEEYNYLAYIDRMQALLPNIQMPFPDTPGDEYFPLNQTLMQTVLAKQLYGFLISLLVSPDYDLSTSYPVRDGKIELPGLSPMTMVEFAARFDSTRLSGLSLRYLAQLNSANFNSKMHQENLRKRGAIYGYTEELELMAIYGFEGITWAHGYTVGRFEQGWQITSLIGLLSGMPSQGNAVLVDDETISEFLNSGDYLLLYENP